MFNFHKKRYFKVLFTICAGFTLYVPYYVPQAEAFPRTNQELELMVDSVVNTGLGYGDFPALNQAEYISIGEAAMALDNNEPVFVVPLGPSMPLKQREVILLPQKIMVWHEVLNEITKDRAFAVTYSPVAGALAVYNTKKPKYSLQLQSSGSQYNSNSILIDLNTNSSWSQMYGMAFFGPLQGVGLEIMPVYWTTWRKARTYFDDPENVKVLSTPRGSGKRYGRDPYGSFTNEDSFYFNNTLIYPVAKVDIRLPLKSQVIGIEMDNKFMAIDTEYVRKKKCVNFFFGEHALVAAYDDKLGAVRIFKRSVWKGKDPLIFKKEGDNLIDFHTRSTWSMDGVCQSGNYVGAYVQEIFGIYSFWYSWAAHNPETEIVPGNSVVPDSALEVGIFQDNQLGKGLDGEIEQSGMGLPWK